MEAAKLLGARGIKSTVANSRFIKPLDTSLILNAARRTKRVVTVEENALIGGFGSAVEELLESSGITDLHLERIGLPDEFVPHGSQALLRSKYNLDAEGIAQRVVSSFPKLASLTKTKNSFRAES
jgi:1-deoxy-D-xylulose-5-phosphate synthase